MQTQPHLINDPENYHRMSAPFEGAAEANAALSAFLMGVRELRQKHRISDVLTVVQVTVRYEDGQIGTAFNMGHNGQMMNVEPMAAFALGQAQADRRESINKLLANQGTKKQ